MVKHHFFIITVLAVLLDQISKITIRSSLEVGERLLSLGFFSILRTENTGAAFGILGKYPELLMWTTVIFIGLVLFYYDTFPKKTIFHVLMAMIFGGALSNLIDRLAFGTITDFIDLSFWPTFNIADSCITIGLVGLIVHWVKNG